MNILAAAIVVLMCSLNPGAHPGHGEVKVMSAEGSDPCAVT